jgi:SAM-dependent methyltransferase
MENFWDKRYAVDEYVYGTQVNAFLQKNEFVFPGKKILALGEGEGRNAVYLASKGYEVLALDQSQVGKQKALFLANQKKVHLEYELGDATEFPLMEDGWAGIYSIFLHMPYTMRVRMHRRVLSALAPGGVFMALYYTPKQLNYGTGGPSELDWLVSEENLKTELKGLRFQLLKETEMTLIEGRGHTGRANAVQCIAVKD